MAGWLQGQLTTFRYASKVDNCFSVTATNFSRMLNEWQWWTRDVRGLFSQSKPNRQQNYLTHSQPMDNSALDVADGSRSEEPARDPTGSCTKSRPMWDVEQSGFKCGSCAFTWKKLTHHRYRTLKRVHGSSSMTLSEFNKNKMTNTNRLAMVNKF